ncbi:hypothetical protein L249_0503 [Ophiocordyceps polyrhachis-furcata BCC 54312]|uniref:Fringe-like glycosyltransferase domain-containing protein n=1 Tax=Ophiocordyceps polyrhachis-furcata BCC 54312 TaxID=1330021 RepID=A0A367LER5_9HYPO|nr:hypothetical protein L249_0503 [Ophiocordyceps polyrhachis-furcata BCC 54312]
MISRSFDYMAPLYRRAHSPRRARSFRRFAWIAIFGVVFSVVFFTATRSHLAHNSHPFFGTFDQDGPSSSDWAPIAEVPLRSHKKEGDCSVDVQRLAEIKKRYGLGETVQYLRRSVRFNRLPGLKRKRMTMIPHKLVPDAFHIVDFSRPQEVYNRCQGPISVDVPVSGFPSTVDASDFIFGVSTTYARFLDPGSSQVEDWTAWLTDGNGHSNGAKLVLTLIEAKPNELAEAADRLRKLGIKATVLASDPTANMAIRYVQLVPTINKMLDASQSYKWVVLCDDDTFFPSMHALVKRFRSLDSSRKMYVGTLSEDIGAVHRHGSQAFGGAGVFLSVPLVRKISKDCAQGISDLKKSRDLQGDMVLRECIYEKTDTRLTTIPSLWQLDLMGDPSGFYESGVKPLSLHHYRSWHEAKPGQMIKIARTCGEDCFMQRFQTADDFVLSGYSVAYYPGGVDFDANQMEKTSRPSQDDLGWNFDYKFGPQRPALERTGKKIAWELQESTVETDGSVSQVYIRRQDDSRWVDQQGGAMSDLDGIIELVWAPLS